MVLNELIARYCANALLPVRAISRLEGLVRTLETDAFTNGQLSRFPIPIDSTLETCEVADGEFPDLVPNDDERLIVYFESGAAVKPGDKWNVNLRLIAWGSKDRFEGVPRHLIGAVLIGEFTRRLEKELRPAAEDPVSSLRCQVTGELPEAGLFSAYTYTQTRSQYLLEPYFAFGLNLNFTFIFNHDCATNSLIINDAIDSCD